MQEHRTNPGWHTMSSRSSEVPVDDDHGDQDGNGVHDESEEQIFGNKWQHERCWR